MGLDSYILVYPTCIRVEWFGTFSWISKWTKNRFLRLVLRVPFQNFHGAMVSARQSFQFQKIAEDLIFNIFFENLHERSSYYKKDSVLIKSENCINFGYLKDPKKLLNFFLEIVWSKNINFCMCFFSFLLLKI